jgi:hypothetical protein
MLVVVVVAAVVAVPVAVATSCTWFFGLDVITILRSVP